MTRRPKLRSSMDLWDQGLLPNGKYGYGHKDAIGPGKDRRRVAIASVLTSFPEEYFTPLSERKDQWAWFVPWVGLWGKAAQIPANRVILYLSPALEFAQEWVVESLVVHELLHVVLGHQLSDCTEEENERQESQIHRIMVELDYPDPAAELTKLFSEFQK